MKKLLILSLLFASHYCYSQDAQSLGNRDGVEMSYRVQKLTDGKKKDTYLVYVTAVNKNNENSFYSQSPDNITKRILNPSFAVVNIRNADEYILVKAPEAKVMTKTETLYYLKPSESVMEQREVSVPHGEQPIVTANFRVPFKKISDFL